MSKLFRVEEGQREQAENANGKPPVKKQSEGVDSDVACATPMKDPSAVGIQSAKELTSAAEPPVRIQEDWIACDKCQKWHLLPYGTEIKQLPERWLCSMLNWLPGMNHCDISEEETTRALRHLNSLRGTMDKLSKVKEKQREQGENANGKPPVKKQSAGELRLGKVDSHVACETPMKDPSTVGLQIARELTSRAKPPVAPVSIVQEDWIACDKCQKWRLLPYGTKIEQLPKRWLCSMLNWLPGMNHCDISEEEMTRALRHLNSLQVGSHVACATPMKDPSTVSIQSTKELTSRVKPPVAPVGIIEEDRIACDKCQKWRLLPYGTEIKQLPKRWLCSMLNWLPGMNHCDISEEETTRALHDLNSLRKNAGTSGAGVISADMHAYRRKEETLVIN